ncbi:MAG: peptidase domain-containing ABC transporter [Proteobacteria bacterium]|nr:peptidase domain-containing ABC transporter [Pseudomonadota bacterium]
MNNKKILDVISSIKDRSIFNFFTKEDLVELSEYSRISTLKNGETFIIQGEKPHEIAILLEGRAHLFNKLPNGKEFHAGELKTFRSVDLSAVLLDTPWHYSAQMDTVGNVLFIQTSPLLSMLKKHKKEYDYLKTMTTDPEVQDFLRPIKYQKGVDIKDIKNFVLSFDIQAFKKDEIIQKENTKQSHVFLLKEGRVQIIQFNDNIQKDKILTKIEPPMLFGHQQLNIKGKAHISIYTYQTLEDSIIYKIPLKAYIALIKKYSFIKSIYDGTNDVKPEIKEYEIKRPKVSDISEKNMLEKDELDDSDEFDYEKDKKYNKKFPIIIQHDEMDCAAASMAMVSKYFGIDMGVPFFRNSIDVGVDGASLYGIAAAAERIGLLTRGVQVDLEDIKDIKLPAITTQGYHFVVVYDISKKHIIIGDPAIGIRKVTHEEFKSKWNNILLLFNATTEFYKNEPKKENIEIYWELLKPYKKIFIQIILISLLLNFMGLATPYFSQQIIDKVLINFDFGLLNIIGAGFLIFIIMVSISGLVRRYLTAFISLQIDIEMSAQLFRHIFRLPASFFASRRTGDTLMRLNDIQVIKNFISQQGIEFLIDILMSVIYVAAIFILSAKIGFIFLIAVAVLIICTIFASKFIYRYYSETVAKSTEAQTILVEGVKNINTLKIFSAEIPWRWKWEEKYAKSSTWQLKMKHVGNFYTLVVELFYKGIPLLVLFMGAKMVISDTMTIGTIIALMSLFAMALGPILNISNIFITLQEVRFGISRLNDIFSTFPEDRLQKYLPLSAESVKGRISFKDVSFRYGNEESPLILNKVNAEIKSGQVVALIGRSGSGKTTMVQLINRLFEPFEGKVLIDGYDVKHYPLTELRRVIAMVTQDSRLFSGTILDNISIGDQFPDIKKATDASILAGADSFIRQHPDGYFRQLFEDGTGLSAGQKQRISIARALYRNPKILIMDEATSSLDPESELAISEAMPNICKDRTVVLVAHRLISIKNCDKIFVLNEGEIIEEGTRTELLKNNGAYAHFTRISD